MRKADLKLTVHLIGSNSPFIVWTDRATQRHTAEWLLGIMKEDGCAVFQDEDDQVHAVVRGEAIAGFGFGGPEESDEEIADLHKRRLRAEVKHWEGMSEGDSWRD